MSTPTGLPALHNVTAYQGDGWLRQYRFWYRDIAGAAQLLDTSGYSGRMQIKTAKSDTTALLSSTPTTNEVQSVAITGSPTGGTFTLSFGGQTTATIAWNATAATVQTALQALTTIGANNVACTGGPLPGTPVTVTFIGSLAGRNVAQMTASSAGLTGGTTPTVTVTTTTQGTSGPILVTTGIQGTAPDQYCLEVFIAGASTATLPAGLVGFYDIELTDPSGRPTTFLFGQFRVEEDITR